MPKGPRGETRPADGVRRALMIAKVATREIEIDRELSSAAAELGRKGGKKRAAYPNGQSQTETLPFGAIVADC